MSKFLKEFEFEKTPQEITYFDNDPLELHNEFMFLHNKSKFRKELTRLQNLIKSYTKAPLMVTSIRDAFLKKEYTEKYLIVLLTTSQYVKEVNTIIEAYSGIDFNPGCVFLEANSKYMLLLTRDMEGLILGVNIMELILKQILENYLNEKRFDEYITIRPFKLIDCSESS